MTMKQKTNYTEKRKNKQTTTTTNTKTRTRRMQNIMRITCAINCASTNFQSLYFQMFNQFSMLIEKSSPVLHFFFSPVFFSPTTHACVPSYKKYINIALISISFSTSLFLLNEARGSFQRKSNTFIFFQSKRYW